MVVEEGTRAARFSHMQLCLHSQAHHVDHGDVAFAPGKEGPPPVPAPRAPVGAKFGQVEPKYSPRGPDMKQLPQFLLARAMGALAGVFALQRPMCVPVHVGALPVASAHYLRDSWRA